jgi:hypothetical protein
LVICLKRIAKTRDGRGPGQAGEVCNVVGGVGPTRLADLEPERKPHHQDKTERDSRAGLLRGRPVEIAVAR